MARKRKSLPRAEPGDGDEDEDEDDGDETKPRKRKSLRRTEPPDDDSDYSPEQSSVTGNVTIARNAKQSEECLERDKSACIILGTANPEACHIIPFAINSTKKTLDKVKAVSMAEYLWPGDHDNFDLLIKNLGCSDKAWNMLSLLTDNYTSGGPRASSPSNVSELAHKARRHARSSCNFTGCNSYKHISAYPPPSLQIDPGRGRSILRKERVRRWWRNGRRVYTMASPPVSTPVGLCRPLMPHRAGSFVQDNFSTS
jgi:hypothetical protein